MIPSKLTKVEIENEYNMYDGYLSYEKEKLYKLLKNASFKKTTIENLLNESNITEECKKCFDFLENSCSEIISQYNKFDFLNEELKSLLLFKYEIIQNMIKKSKDFINQNIQENDILKSSLYFETLMILCLRSTKINNIVISNIQYYREDDEIYIKSKENEFNMIISNIIDRASYKMEEAMNTIMKYIDDHPEKFPSEITNQTFVQKIISNMKNFSFQMKENILEFIKDPKKLLFISLGFSLFLLMSNIEYKKELESYENNLNSNNNMFRKNVQ